MCDPEVISYDEIDKVYEPAEGDQHQERWGLRSNTAVSVVCFCSGAEFLIQGTVYHVMLLFIFGYIIPNIYVIDYQ